MINFNAKKTKTKILLVFNNKTSKVWTILTLVFIRIEKQAKVKIMIFKHYNNNK